MNPHVLSWESTKRQRYGPSRGDLALGDASPDRPQSATRYPVRRRTLLLGFLAAAAGGGLGVTQRAGPFPSPCVRCRRLSQPSAEPVQSHRSHLLLTLPLVYIVTTSLWEDRQTM